ncbi:MAG: DUF3015 family protein [Bdellovibrionaceae bacterium]|nr:DUF3015 family protein [Pseudobdellovibrionaceae bacterium]MBX3034087.1 DUF3015 family protein [Pseudobdellovibrionaceae bacterium]
MKKQLFVSAALVLAFGVAHAQGKRPLIQDLSGQGYGDAGCGLGSVVFGSEKGAKQVLAATTNGISGNQTFGISTGSLNCDSAGIFAKTNDFVETNKVALETDIARGQGETLATLGRMLECDSEQFGSNLKNNYRKSFPHGGASSEQITALAAGSCNI